MDGVGATVIAERVEYLDENGRLVTETLRDFTKKALTGKARQGMANPKRLAIGGGSHGGTMVGYAVTKYPALFACAIESAAA